jgi:outer membrane protein
VSKIRIVSIAAAAVAGSLSMAAQAADYTPFEVRVGAVWVNTAGGSDAIPAVGLPSDKIVVQSKVIPELDVSYFFTKNIAAEVVLTYPQHMNVAINYGGIGHIGYVDVLPPDFMAQYHFLPDGPFDPYVGAGINLTWLTNVQLKEPAVQPLSLNTSKVSVDPALQVGLDYKITKNWVANFDFKYEWMGFDLKAAGTKVSTLHVDPTLLRLAVGYKF